MTISEFYKLIVKNLSKNNCKIVKLEDSIVVKIFFEVFYESKNYTTIAFVGRRIRKSSKENNSDNGEDCFHN